MLATRMATFRAIELGERMRTKRDHVNEEGGGGQVGDADDEPEHDEDDDTSSGSDAVPEEVVLDGEDDAPLDGELTSGGVGLEDGVEEPGGDVGRPVDDVPDDDEDEGIDVGEGWNALPGGKGRGGGRGLPEDGGRLEGGER